MSTQVQSSADRRERAADLVQPATDQKLRDLHGRQLNGTNEFYQLPADAEEHNRLDIQHEALKLSMNGIILKPEAVRRAMTSNTSENPAALDLGTGSGSWALDFAKLYPEATVVGFDLVRPVLRSPPPPNCHFVQGDMRDGLEQYKNSQNIVHIRCVTTGVPEPRSLYETASELLRPGGVLLAVDGEMGFYDAEFHQLDDNASEGEKGFSCAHKLIITGREVMISRTPKCMSFFNLPTWLKEMEAWEETGSEGLYIPLGPWKENMTEDEVKASELMREDMLRISESLRPLLIGSGQPGDTVDLWKANMKDELMNLRVKLYVKWHFSWAIKKAAA